MKKIGLSIGAALVLVLSIMYFTTGTVFGMTIGNFVNKTTGYTEYYTFLNATTTTATSTNNAIGDGAFKIAGAKNVNVFFSRGGATSANTGSTLFKVQVSPDNVTWYDYNVMTANVATTTYPTAQSSFTISAATSTTIAKLRDLGWYSMRVIVVETTDGEHTVRASAEF